ncbi:hypothetical protein PRIC2_000368 [Phytophthora ramorum]
MTKFPLEHAPFPPLHLVDSDKEALLNIADIFVTETMEDYERHLHAHNGIVDARQWVRVKQFEDVVVYQDRQALKDRRLSRVNHSRDRNDKNKEMLKLLWSGTTESVVETYVKAFIDLMGDMPLRVATTLSTTGVVSVWKLSELALMKKLNWKLSQRRAIVPGDRGKACSVCGKTVRGSMVRRRTCKLCVKLCCSHCCVPKKMFCMASYGRAVVEKAANVCKECLRVTSHMNGADLAQSELSKTSARHNAYAYWAAPSPTSSSSSIVL